MDELKNTLRTFLRSNNLSCNLGEISNLRQIGEGGNGIVFSGELQGFEIAIKFLVNPTKDKLTRFKAEYLNVSILPEHKSISKPLLYEEYEIEELPLCKKIVNEIRIPLFIFLSIILGTSFFLNHFLEIKLLE